MAVNHFEITKSWTCFIDKHGSGFAGGFVLYPAITFYKSKDYLQIGFSFMKRTVSITFMYFSPKERWQKNI